MSVQIPQKTHGIFFVPGRYVGAKRTLLLIFAKSCAWLTCSVMATFQAAYTYHVGSLLLPIFCAFESSTPTAEMLKTSFSCGLDKKARHCRVELSCCAFVIYGIIKSLNIWEMQTATFCGQQGRISRPVRAILSGRL